MTNVGNINVPKQEAGNLEFNYNDLTEFQKDRIDVAFPTFQKTGSFYFFGEGKDIDIIIDDNFAWKVFGFTRKRDDAHKDLDTDKIIEIEYCDQDLVGNIKIKNVPLRVLFKIYPVDVLSDDTQILPNTMDLIIGNDKHCFAWKETTCMFKNMLCNEKFKELARDKEMRVKIFQAMFDVNMGRHIKKNKGNV